MTELTKDEIHRAFATVRYEVPAAEVLSGARRRQHRRRVALSALPAAGLLAASGYVMTHREINEPRAVACSAQFDQMGDMSIIGRVEGETATETCLREMSETRAWNPPPANPVECVSNYPNGDGGALVVFPAPPDMTQEEACQRLGAALPRGAED
jgi:hypothetical protein